MRNLNRSLSDAASRHYDVFPAHHEFRNSQGMPLLTGALSVMNFQPFQCENKRHAICDQKKVEVRER